MICLIANEPQSFGGTCLTLDEYVGLAVLCWSVQL